MTDHDAFGSPVQHGDAASVDAWNTAWDHFLHYTGDSIATLAPAIAADPDFALGSVMSAASLVLGGNPLSDQTIIDHAATARARAQLERERRHVDALDHMVAGNFSQAAAAWTDISRTGDFAATRLAHDAWTHVGNEPDRLQASADAVALWGDDRPGWNFVSGMHAFSLGEAGHPDAAIQAATVAAEADPLDFWAVHALAHVYEDTDDTQAAFDLLDTTDAGWHQAGGFAVHIWWHLSLRFIAAGETERALAVFDAQRSNATTMMRCCDLISLLWRLELASVDVGDRWSELTDLVAALPDRLASGYQVMHEAMLWGRQPDHRGAVDFRGALGRDADPSENGEIFRTVVPELVAGMTQFASGNTTGCIATLERDPTRHHMVGGSNAQRTIIPLTVHVARRPQETT